MSDQSADECASAPSGAASAEPIDLRGYLRKENPRGLFTKMWKQRYFVLNGDMLTYAKTDGGEIIKIVPLHRIKDVKRGDDGKNCFKIRTNIFQPDGTPRIFHLKGQDQLDVDGWVHSLCYNMQLLKERRKRDQDGENESTEDIKRTSSALSSGEGFNSNGVITLDKNRITARLACLGNDEEDELEEDWVEGGMSSSSYDLLHYGEESKQKKREAFQADVISRTTSAPSNQEASDPRQGKTTMMTKNIFRKIVSKNKRRYEENGFSLDLSYMTPQLIAMGVPSDGVEGKFRNHVSDVYRFFETRHPETYMIFNLCSERMYDPSIFHNRVEFWPFDDHQPPYFEMLRPLCARIENYLLEKPANVAAVHCKAGKGRTGVVGVAMLLQQGYCSTAEEALQSYGALRTKDGAGVTVRGQRRYCHYFAQNIGMVRPLKEVDLVRVNIIGAPAGFTNFKVRIKGPAFSKEGFELVCQASPTQHFETGAPYFFSEGHGITLRGDVSVSVRATCSGLLGAVSREQSVCHLWFHTSFEEDLGVYLPLDQLDGAAVKDSRFSPKFAVEVVTQARTSRRLPPLVHHPFSGICGDEKQTSSKTIENINACFESVTGVLSACQVAKLPRSSDHREADKLDSDMLRDTKKFIAALSSQGLLTPELAAETARDAPATLSRGRKAVVLFPFDPEKEDEQRDFKKMLRVGVNETFILLRRENQGWWLGMRRGDIGWVPRSYCVETEERPAIKVDGASCEPSAGSTLDETTSGAATEGTAEESRREAVCALSGVASE